MLRLTAALLLGPLLVPTASADALSAAPSDTTTIVVMGTTDLHGYVLPWDYYADQPDTRQSLAQVATLVDSVRAVHPHTLLLDAGDWLQGNPFAEYFARVDSVSAYPLLAAADRMRYDAFVLGNHEFNFGIELLGHRIQQTATPIIGANIYVHGTDEPAYAPYLLREVGGVIVGIVGVTTPGSAVWDRPRVQGRLDFGDAVEAAHRFVAAARADGAEVVIVLGHTGIEGDTSYPTDELGEENVGRIIAETVPGVDALVLGHTHRPRMETVSGADGRPVAIIQAGRWADHLALAKLRLVRSPEGVRIVETATRMHRVAHAPPHPAIEALAAEGHEAVREHMAEAFAETTSEWPTERARLEPTAAVALIHAAQREATGAQLSAAAAFSTNLTLGPGGITRGQLAQLYPYENQLFVVEISGRDVRGFLEHGAQYYLTPEIPGDAPTVNRSWPGFNFDMIDGVTYTLDLTRPVGERVTQLEFEGRPVADDETFTMAVNSYRASGGGGFPGMTDDAIIERIDRPVRAMIEDFLRERGSIEPEDVLTPNWQLTSEPVGTSPR